MISMGGSEDLEITDSANKYLEKITINLKSVFQICSTKELYFTRRVKFAVVGFLWSRLFFK
jgi:hypothetical protein